MIEIDDRNFESEVLQSNKVVVVDLWAPWCSPCVAAGLVFAEIDAEGIDGFKFAKLNVDENINISQMYNVMSIPTFLVFKRGELLKTIVGYQSKEKLLQDLAEVK